MTLFESIEKIKRLKELNEISAKSIAESVANSGYVDFTMIGTCVCKANLGLLEEEGFQTMLLKNRFNEREKQNESR